MALHTIRVAFAYLSQKSQLPKLDLVEVMTPPMFFPFYDEIFLSNLSVSPQTNWHCQKLIHPLFNIWISIMCHNSKLFPFSHRLKCKFSSGYFFMPPRPPLFPPLSFQDSPEKQGKKETQKQIVVHKKWIFRPSSCLHQLSTVSPLYNSDARSTPLWYFFLKYWLTMFWNEQIKSYSSDIRLVFYLPQIYYAALNQETWPKNVENPRHLGSPRETRAVSKAAGD